jgi:hypothetical protein
MKPCHKNVLFTDPSFTRFADARLHQSLHLYYMNVTVNRKTGNLKLCIHINNPLVFVVRPGASIKSIIGAPCNVLPDWKVYDVNPTMADYDYPAMRAQMAPLRRELLTHVMHPSRLIQLGI